MSTESKLPSNKNHQKPTQNPILEETSRRTSTSKEDVLKNVVIQFGNGSYSISASLYHITYNVVHAVSPKTHGIKYKVSKTQKEEVFVGDVTYVLEEVTIEELQGPWDNKIPSLVIKANGRFYHTQVTRHLTLNKRKMPRKHLCGACNTYCQKVLDASKHIENYPFIKMGYEIFGTDKNVLVVYSCSDCS